MKGIQQFIKSKSLREQTQFINPTAKTNLNTDLSKLLVPFQSLSSLSKLILVESGQTLNISQR